MPSIGAINVGNQYANFNYVSTALRIWESLLHLKDGGSIEVGRTLEG